MYYLAIVRVEWKVFISDHPDPPCFLVFFREEVEAMEWKDSYSAGFPAFFPAVVLGSRPRL